ncbi:MAG: hypothetical protein A2X61_04595 [Ignavibacteria bacterium GWB2_35_12]|nr:MAG: hypothetical protein A2X63_13390 [Ignavibacteria bacterium GWA2_35_8]OGU41909.1 MAG: hypothetical protein A2X61_04595 [Ignavibacteria bacterium GWB2_35_12]OGU87184.1 MAG: hypothetical protein A2220_07870 [Ignavibacteria bacterium RIFOXYA2_FULL_35_10]OGV24583.1 MAG: hypothetical protein A2475_09185 [Ignavibacteria bacterium RIFOXYC2_FULL_35_21]
MKKYIVYFFFIIASLNCQAEVNKFEIIPIVINFRGVEAKNDTIIAFGDFGSMLISYDFGQNWKQVRVFDKGIILKLYWDDTTMVALNDAGDVASSYNKGLNWEFVTNLGDSVLAIIKYPDGYFLRSRNKLFTITDDFKLKKEFQLYSKVLSINISFYTPKYPRSLAYFNNELIAEADSSNFIRFDINLSPLDTFSFFKSVLFDTSYKYFTGYQLDTDLQYFYFQVVADHIINDSTSKRLDSIYRTKDFKIIEPFEKLYQPYSIYKIINDKLYLLQKNSKYLIDTTKFSNTDYYRYGNDFSVVNDTQIIVGANKLIEFVNIKDSSIRIISEFTNWSRYLVPEKIGESSFLFFTGDQFRYLPFIYRTDDNAITLKPVVDIKNGFYKSGYPWFIFRFKYFDEKENKLYFIEQTRVLISENYGISFISKWINGYTFLNGPEFGGYKNAQRLPNLQKINDEYIITEGFFYKKDTVRETIYNLDKDFIINNFMLVTGKVIDYIFSKDTNTFLIHNANGWDRTSEVNFTSDKGINWEIIKKYPITETCKNFKEIEINNQKYLALVHVNKDEPSFRIDAVNLSNNQFDSVYKWTTNNPDSNWTWFGVGIENENNWVYITFQDTLFYTNDLFDKSKWRYQILPNNGRIRNFPFKKFGDKFFVGYADDNNPSTRGYLAETNIYWLKPLDPINSVEENEIEVQNYLYVYPPFPIPAKNYVKTLIYWDLSIDIDKDEIAVYNIYGVKIEGKEKIRIDKKNSYSGWLVWDCSDVESGIYFIKINHGTKTKYIKVMVDR